MHLDLPEELLEPRPIVGDLELLENLTPISDSHCMLPATNVNRHRKLSLHHRTFPPLRLVYWQSYRLSTIPEDAAGQKK